MENTFNTINKKSTSEIIEKKSRFIADVCPITSEEDATKFINQIKKQHHMARHHCFAYSIDNGKKLKFSDDGEPQGTAGKPILNAITSQNVTNLVVVVTRYFGGILLGTGGLIRAYGKSAKNGILTSEIVLIDTFFEVNLLCDYTISGKIQYELENVGSQFNTHIFNIEYTDKVTFVLFCQENFFENFKNHIINFSNNKVSILVKSKKTLKVINNAICFD